jgi:hypothetical protein
VAEKLGERYEHDTNHNSRTLAVYGTHQRSPFTQ